MSKTKTAHPGCSMKTRRHHNNKGLRQVRRGKTEAQVKSFARRFGFKYGG